MDKENESVIIKLSETSSTNTELKLLQQKFPLTEGSTVIADFQTAGRGQVGNSWHSEKEQNLLFSFILYPNSIQAKEQFIISQIVSLALVNLLKQFIKNVRIKWPNDIYWGEKKIAGILIENSLMGQHIDYTIVGVGLNVNEDPFPPHLANPISIKQITKKEYNREIMLADFNKEFTKIYQRFKAGEESYIKNKYMQHLYRKEGVYWYSDKEGKFRAKIDAILPSGHIILKTHPHNEKRKYSFKEVAFENDDRV